MIRVLFFGTPDFAAQILQALTSSDLYSVCAVVTNPDKPAGRGKVLTSSPVKKVAESCSVPVIQPPHIKKNTTQFLDEVSKYGPFDIGVVVAYGHILPKAVLDLPKVGCVNIHASLLPRWRGAAPIQRSIMAGDKESGICLMKMDEGLDTGPVYSRATTSIVRSDGSQQTTCCTAGELHNTLASLGAKLLLQDLPNIVSGKLQAIPQSEIGITYADKITNDEGRINWNMSPQEIQNHMHALSLFPGSFTTLGGSRIKIFRVYPLSASRDNSAPPGTVTRSNGSDLRVTCGHGGEIQLLELQLEGKRIMSAQECINGHLLQESTTLGD